ncbi:hypothetical protein JCM11641_000484 [Rhodosporidiobolus odoratus]
MPEDFSYDALHARYGSGIPCPPDFSFPTHVIDQWAKKQASLPALHWVSHDFRKERLLTYSELSDLSHRAGRVFQRAGLKKGDRVMIVLPRVCEWWIAVFGLQRIGAVAVPGTSLLVAKDLKYRAEACQAKAFIGCASSCSRFEEVASSLNVSLIFQVRTDDAAFQSPRVDFQAAIGAVPTGTRCAASDGRSKDDLAILFFTSGTTSMPKLVLLCAEYMLGHTISGLWYKCEPGKTFLCMADLGWAKAAYGSLGCFCLGGTYFVQPPPPGPFSPIHLIDSLHRYPISALCAPPTIYRALVSPASLAYLREHRPKSLEHCVGAGEPLNASVIKDWGDATGLMVKDAYGQSETVICVGNFEGIEVRRGSMGKVAPFFEVSIIGPGGEELGVDQEGEIALRTDSGAGQCWIFKGYVKNGKIDKREKHHAGKTWYCTGDRGKRDKDGYFWFVGRDDDVITSSGYRIGPFEVESALKAHPAVAESAAVGSPDLSRGEIVKAFVVLSEEYKEKLDRGNEEGVQMLVSEIQDFVKHVTAPYKFPREVEFVHSLPKTISGKIRRVELREAEKQKKADVVRQLKSKL